MKKELFVTKEYYDNLIKEYDHLKLVVRKKNIEDIKESLTQGDLAENAEYTYARTEQAKTESRILEIEDLLGKIHIMEENDVRADKVTIGTKVTILYIDDNEEDTFEMTGTLEANALSRKISNESPIGKAIFNKKIGEIVSVHSPAGQFQVKITNISK